MALTFDEAKRLFAADQLNALAGAREGARFLKLRSLSRTEHLLRLYEKAEMDVPDVGARELFEEAFNSGITEAEVEKCIAEIYAEERRARQAHETDLLNQLYRVQEFNWGGLHQNSLEKTIVDNYVKKITDYEKLCKCVENEILTSMRGYVICSWYNHWTSIIIEDLFKDHVNVLPAVGLVKKIDFFINDTPFDLKVTYLPEGYIKLKRKEAGLKPELTLLKQLARAKKLPIPSDLSDAALLQDLWTKSADEPSSEARALLSQLAQFRAEIVAKIAKDPTELITWLYENQGDRRFDASNRLFLVLVDQRNYFESWKLKRAKPLMSEAVNTYLDKCKSSPGRKIAFRWEGSVYHTISDVVLVCHQ